ncbi:MAG: hypothetical protein RLZZ165_1516 [Bacteroidota bacterium]|jgi:hypothetical protein
MRNELKMGRRCRASEADGVKLAMVILDFPPQTSLRLMQSWLESGAPLATLCLRSIY